MLPRGRPAGRPAVGQCPASRSVSPSPWPTRRAASFLHSSPFSAILLFIPSPRSLLGLSRATVSACLIYTREPERLDVQSPLRARVFPESGARARTACVFARTLIARAATAAPFRARPQSRLVCRCTPLRRCRLEVEYSHPTPLGFSSGLAPTATTTNTQ